MPNNTSLINLAGTLGTTTGTHANGTSCIIGATNGIAPDVDFYCVADSDIVSDRLTFTTAIDYLINNNVNIINMSFRFSNVGIYDDECKYLDYIINNNLVTIVASSGNDLPYTSAPACGMNIIAVGSNDADKNVSYFSSWGAQSSFLEKPDLVAPGGGILNITPFVNEFGGTSASAPMVSGTIALLMEEFPILILSPSLVKTAILNGAEMLPSQSTYFDQQCGYGLLNYQNSRNYLNLNDFSTFTINPYNVNGDIVCSLNVTIPSNNRIEINSSLLVSLTGDYVQASMSEHYSHLLLKLYDVGKGAYRKQMQTISNNYYLSYANPSNSSRNYNIELSLLGNKSGLNIEAGSVVYNLTSQQHVHDYTFDISYYSPSKHKRSCGCLNYSLSTHVVRASDPGRFKPCVDCGAFIDTQNYDVIVLNNEYVITQNGSYSLPNGVIMLVDQDIQSYLDGTLIFNYGFI